MALRFVLSDIRKGMEQAIKDYREPIAKAATAAVTEAADVAKADGRNSIARAGFSTKWQNALRADVFPRKGKTSMSPAALVFHKIPYAEVFERGAKIRGNPLLWIPVGKAARGPRISPKGYAVRVSPLVSVNRPGKPPLLAEKSRPGTRGEVVFIGIDAVSIRKKFDIIGSVKRAAARLGEFYLKNVKVS